MRHDYNLKPHHEALFNITDDLAELIPNFTDPFFYFNNCDCYFIINNNASFNFLVK